MPESVIAPVRSAFRAIAQTVVPEAASLTEPEWTAVESIVESQLRIRTPKIRRQLGLLIRAIELLPVIVTARRFSTLDPARRVAVLGRLQDAPLLLLRRGMWGLRTLILMGYYARPEAGAEIGYRADPRGWEARR
ncbi:MAG TPA: hypothetical protein VGI92_08505 [Gemmatimonadales bacterium]|jgi:hypothetical protein